MQGLVRGIQEKQLYRGIFINEIGISKNLIQVSITVKREVIMANSVAIIADSKSGKTYKKEVTPENLNSLVGRKIGDEVDGIFFELPGYRLKITGGSTNDGFAMKKDLQIAGRKRILRIYNKGKRAKDGYRKRVTFRGSVIGADVSQLNLQVTQYGPEPLDAPAPEAKEEKKE